MTIHIGVDLLSGKLSYYNEFRKESADLNINKVKHNEMEKVPLIFDEIKSKINGNYLGSICFCLKKYCGNKIRKKLIESGLNFGFKNVEIINCETAFYLNAMSQTDYKPLNGNVIWIFDGNCFQIWEINDSKAKFIGKWYADLPKMGNIFKIMTESKLNKLPDVVLYFNKTDESNLRKISNSCKFFHYDFTSYCYSKGSVLKARITAGDREFIRFNVINFLSKEISLKIGGKEVTSYRFCQKLPIIHTQKIKKKDGDVLQIKSSGDNTVSFELPPGDEINIMFKIDTNEIYSLNFDENVDHNLEAKEATENSNFGKNDGILHFFQTPSTSEYYAIPKLSNYGNTKIDAIGIDLGTSRCCAAVSRKNGINTVPLDSNGERLLPSYVSYDEKNVKCGKIVVNRLRYHSKSTIFDSKRIIGRSFNDVEIDSFWPFNLSYENNKVFMEINTIDEKRKITAEEVASELLKFIKQKSEEYQGIHLTKAVITVPAAFTESQKEATKEAAKLAGWEIVELLPEPVAAAFAYFIDRPMSNDLNILLFDLGGGTLDVCIFKIENEIIKIISNIGDSNVGGKNFDTVLINYFKTMLKADFGISALKDKKYKLMLECQVIKEDLSSIPNSSKIAPSSTYRLDGLHVIDEGLCKALLYFLKNNFKVLMDNIQVEINRALLQVGNNSLASAIGLKSLNAHELRLFFSISIPLLATTELSNIKVQVAFLFWHLCRMLYSKHLNIEIIEDLVPLFGLLGKAFEIHFGSLFKTIKGHRFFAHGGHELQHHGTPADFSATPFESGNRLLKLSMTPYNTRGFDRNLLPRHLLNTVVGYHMEDMSKRCGLPSSTYKELYESKKKQLMSQSYKFNAELLPLMQADDMVFYSIYRSTFCFRFNPTNNSVSHCKIIVNGVGECCRVIIGVERAGQKYLLCKKLKVFNPFDANKFSLTLKPISDVLLKYQSLVFGIESETEEYLLVPLKNVLAFLLLVEFQKKTFLFDVSERYNKT